MNTWQLVTGNAMALRAAILHWYTTMTSPETSVKDLQDQEPRIYRRDWIVASLIVAGIVALVAFGLHRADLLSQVITRTTGFIILAYLFSLLTSGLMWFSGNEKGVIRYSVARTKGLWAFGIAIAASGIGVMMRTDINAWFVGTLAAAITGVVLPLISVKDGQTPKP